MFFMTTCVLAQGPRWQISPFWWPNETCVLGWGVGEQQPGPSCMWQGLKDFLPSTCYRDARCPAHPHSPCLGLLAQDGGLGEPSLGGLGKSGLSPCSARPSRFESLPGPTSPSRSSPGPRISCVYSLPSDASGWCFRIPAGMKPSGLRASTECAGQPLAFPSPPLPDP